MTAAAASAASTGSTTGARSGKTFFPQLISSPFMTGMHAVFLLAAVMCFVAAIASLLLGEAVIHGSHESAGALPDGAIAVTLETTVLEPQTTSVWMAQTIRMRHRMEQRRHRGLWTVNASTAPMLGSRSRCPASWKTSW